MNFTYALFPDVWHGFAAFITFAILFWVAKWGNWGEFLRGPQLNVWLASIAILCVLWSLKAGVLPGLNLHILGAMALTLMFGVPRALGVLSLVLLGLSFNGTLEWGAWPINFLTMAVWPVCFAGGWRFLVERFLPPHLFIYIFAQAFFGAGVTLLAEGLMANCLLIGSGAYSFDFLLERYIPYFVLVGFSESWLSGMFVTLFIVYRPEWVASFSDERYLKKRPLL